MKNYKRAENLFIIIFPSGPEKKLSQLISIYFWDVGRNASQTKHENLGVMQTTLCTVLKYIFQVSQNKQGYSENQSKNRTTYHETNSALL